MKLCPIFCFSCNTLFYFLYPNLLISRFRTCYVCKKKKLVKENWNIQSLVLMGFVTRTNQHLRPSTIKQHCRNMVKIELQIWWVEPDPCNSATHGRLAKTQIASYLIGFSPLKNKVNIVWSDGPHIRY